MDKVAEKALELGLVISEEVSTATQLFPTVAAVTADAAAAAAAASFAGNRHIPSSLRL